MYPLEILQSSVDPELLFVLPLLGPALGALNFFDLVVDITCIGNKRVVTMEGQRFALLGRNPGGGAGPGYHSLRWHTARRRQRPDHAGADDAQAAHAATRNFLFTQIVTSPGNEALALGLDTVGTFGQLVTGIAIFAPTNAAVEGRWRTWCVEKNDFFYSATTNLTKNN